MPKAAARPYIAAGVKADLEQFMTDYSALSTVRYEAFCQLWREKNISFIFCGRSSEMEMREFTEECLRIASEFLLPPYNFQVQVGAVYLLYGLYFKQPNNPRVRIRLTLPMWQHLQTFTQDVHGQSHLDTEFVYLKLLHAHAFDYVSQTYYPPTLKPTSHDLAQERENTEDQRNTIVSMQRSSLADQVNLTELANIHSKYQEIKLALQPGTSGKPHPSLDVIAADFHEDITKRIDKHEEWRRRKAMGLSAADKDEVAASEVSQGQTEPQEEDVGSRRARLRERAYEVGPQSGWRMRPKPQTSAESPRNKRKKQEEMKREEISRMADPSPETSDHGLLAELENDMSEFSPKLESEDDDPDVPPSKKRGRRKLTRQPEEMEQEEGTGRGRGAKTRGTGRGRGARTRGTGRGRGRARTRGGKK